MHHGLLGNLLFPIFVVIALTFCAAITLVVGAANRSIEQAGRLSLMGKAQTLSDATAASIRRGSEDTAVSAAIPLVLSSLDRTDSHGYETAKEKQHITNTLLGKISAISGIYESMFVSCSNGTTLASSLPEALNKLNISTLDWFHTTINTKMVTFSEPFLSSITGDVLTAVSRPVSYNGQHGTLTAAMRICSILHAPLERAEESHHIRAMVLSAKGLVAGAINHDIVAKVSYTDTPWFIAIGARQRGTIDAIVDGKEVIVGFARLPEGWTAVVIAERADLMAASQTVTFIGVCTLALTLLLSTLCIYFVVRSVTKDIGVLATYAQAVSLGQPADPPVMGRKDELGMLGGHLAHMVESLRKSISAAEEANRLKGQFLANMSHEIRTPMNGIMGMCHLCLCTTLTTVQRDYISKAQTSAKNLLGILNDILDFSKIEAQCLTIEKHPFVLSTLLTEVEDVVRWQTRAAGLALHLRVGPRVPEHLIGDALRLRQVLLNLVGNAVKFTHEGGVSVDVDVVPMSFTAGHMSPLRLVQGRLVQGSRAGQHATDLADGAGLTLDHAPSICLEFSVRDTGIGMDQNGLDRLFRPFSQVDGSTTRRFGGTGLGLAISRHLVELMGGTIVVESTLGQGSNFRFTLPFTEPEAGQVQVSTQHQNSDVMLHPAHKGKRVLLVEDNEINQEIAREILMHAGLDVAVCENGQESVDILSADGAAFDVVLMDIQMPVMDGLEATRRIRALPGKEKYPPIIAMTANALLEEREKSLQAGMVDHLTKPLDIRQVFIVLNRCFTQ